MDEVLEKLTEKGEFAIAILNKELKFSSDEED